MWRRRFTMLLASAGLLLILVSPALADRVALVIGNAAYNQDDAKLKNPVNDATAVAAALRRLGFQVIAGKDLSEEDFYDKIEAFDNAARSAQVALFFYAGHGLQVNGRNYLAPVDLRLETRQDLRRHAIELAAVLEVMRSETNLVILDACRNNPLAGELARSLGLNRAMAASRGLTRVESASGTLIAYATEPGSVAADGTGDHSPYTAALLEHLETPGLSVQDLFTQVTASVLDSTDERQKPWTHSSLSKIVRLVPGDEWQSTTAAPQPPAPASGQTSERLTAEQLAAERLFWESVKDSEDAADIQAYLDRYPGGTYEALAHNRLKRLASSAAPGEPVQEVPAVSLPSVLGPESVEAGLGLERSERRLIQLGLSAEGFDPGPADGLFGRGTRGAIGRWQASRGEEATGYLDVESAKLLLASGRQHNEQEAAHQAAAAAEQQRREQEARQRAQREAQERARRDAEERARRKAAVEAERRRRELEPGRRFRDCDGCPEMVVVPAGSFVMGSPSNEKDRYEDEYGDARRLLADTEVPQHRVTIVDPFAVGVYEVTREEFAHFVRETGHSMAYCYDPPIKSVATWKNPFPEHPGSKTTDQHPVVCVRWDDAQAYVRWLSDKAGHRYRLLSESEWEYVVRAGTSTARYWGETESQQCVYENGLDLTIARDMKRYVRRDSEKRGMLASCDDGYVHTAPVGSFEANGFGLHDVLGNVSEWVQDCWHHNYAGAPDDGRAWERDCYDLLGVMHVNRGGSYLGGNFGGLRATYRGSFPGNSPHYRNSDLGFRVARELTP